MNMNRHSRSTADTVELHRQLLDARERAWLGVQRIAHGDPAVAEQLVRLLDLADIDQMMRAAARH